MKKALVCTAAPILLYSFFREFSPVKVFIICLCLGAAYLISRTPAKYIAAMKYPLICFELALTALFIVYPKINIPHPGDAIVIFISFYGLTFSLITIEEKGGKLVKEVTALSILFLSAAFNLFMIGKLFFIISISVTTVFFLFIIGKNRLVPITAGYAFAIIAGMFLFNKGMTISGVGIKITDVEKYFLLATSFLFLILAFTGFVKKSSMIELMVFFGFLYTAVDVFMVLGLKLSTGLLYQPLAALFVLTPLIGTMLKAEKERS